MSLLENGRKTSVWVNIYCFVAGRTVFAQEEKLIIASGQQPEGAAEHYARAKGNHRFFKDMHNRYCHTAGDPRDHALHEIGITISDPGDKMGVIYLQGTLGDIAQSFHSM